MSIALERITLSRTGRPVLSSLSASIPASGLTCLIGPNGSGKTTLLSVLTGELRPGAGSYRLGGIDGTGLTQHELSRYFAIIPQQAAAPQYLTVAELVALGRYSPRGALFRRLSERDRATVDACLERCGMTSFAARRVEQLSGGEQQRAWLAFGLAQEKEFLLLDESLSGMDFFVRTAFFRLLKDIASGGRAVVLTSHDLDMVEQYADRVLVLSRGKVLYEGPPRANLQELFAQSNA